MNISYKTSFIQSLEDVDEILKEKIHDINHELGNIVHEDHLNISKKLLTQKKEEIEQLRGYFRGIVDGFETIF